MCGSKLEYLDQGKDFTCFRCGQTETGNIICPQGHYVCDACHGQGAFDFIKDSVLAAKSANPFEIAEALMADQARVPMLGCENAWIAAGSFMAALKNEGTLHVTDAHISEALNRTKRQAVGGYCGLTGVCGIVPAIGACFSIILGAACPKDHETAATMKIVARIVDVIAAETGPCCCKNFARKALAQAIQSAHDTLQVSLPYSDAALVCTDSERHPHGCRQDKCTYYKGGRE